MQVKVEEDTTLDAETSHTALEAVHYLAIEGDGALTGQAPATESKYYYFNGQRIALMRDGVLYTTSQATTWARPAWYEGSTSRATPTRWPRAGIVQHPGVGYPYGVERWSWTLEGTFTTDYRFTGQRLQAGLGLYHMGARFYDPYLARWLSADTIVPNPANLQSFNRYSYTRNNPIKFRDPSGHMELNEDHAYHEGVSDSYYCQISPDAPYCQTDWEEVGWAAVGFVAWAAGPSLIKGGIEVVRTVGVRVVGGRILKATGEEIAESAMTGRDPDPVNIVLDAATEIGDEYYVAARRSGPVGLDPDHHNANVTVRNADGQIVHHERIVSGNMTPEEQALPFPQNTLASHTEARAVRQFSLQVDQSMTITGQLPPYPSCKGVMRRTSQETGATIVYQWRENGGTQRWIVAPQ